jgi:transposase-like protein
MPWKECSVMDERLRFVAKLLDGESMTDVCREFGISRKTGYKILPLQRARCRGVERSLPPSGALCQPPATPCMIAMSW